MPQPRLPESSDKLPGVDGSGAGSHRARPPVVWQVVVVVVESPTRQAERAGEVVELVQVRVADQVGEASAARRPDRLVDEDGHRTGTYLRFRLCGVVIISRLGRYIR